MRAIAAKRDGGIDFSDVPEVLDWSGAEIGKFYRPMKKPVTMRLDADVLAWLKSGGRGYQTKANWLLRHAMVHSRRQGSTCEGGALAARGKSRRQRKKG